MGEKTKKINHEGLAKTIPFVPKNHPFIRTAFKRTMGQALSLRWSMQLKRPIHSDCIKEEVVFLSQYLDDLSDTTPIFPMTNSSGTPIGFLRFDPSLVSSLVSFLLGGVEKYGENPGREELSKMDISTLKSVEGTWLEALESSLTNYPNFKEIHMGEVLSSPQFVKYNNPDEAGFLFNFEVSIGSDLGSLEIFLFSSIF